MREQLSEKKYNAYADAVKMFYSVLKDAKAHRTTNNGVMMDRMIDIKRDIFMYGSDKVFKAFKTNDVAELTKLSLRTFLKKW